jgi:hypothetical protein
MSAHRVSASLLVDTTRFARARLHTALVAAGLVAGCGLGDGDDLTYGVHASEVAVSQYQTTTCSTSVVVGLSKQIAEEVGCMSPGGLVKFDPTPNLKFTSTAVLPYLNGNARTKLLEVAQTRVVQVNSAFRTVAQQYLLYRWYQLGRCGITAAATPGRSNHEGGRALDLQNYSSLISAMAAKGWSHNIPNDPVHFEYLSAPDIRGRDVKAFQRLHNRNHPTDEIAEDGLYGPQTEARLKAAPATGFAIGATCGERVAGADVVMIDGPDKMAPGTKAKFSITVDNTGALDWPASTKIVVAGDGDSELYDAATWVSPREVGTVGIDVVAGGRTTLDIHVAAPVVTEETPYFTQLALTTANMTFGTINLAVTVTPNGDENTSGDADDENDPDMEAGGCATGGGSGWAVLLLPLLLVVRRRR